MKLIFYGRQTTPAAAAGPGVLTIAPKGSFSFSTAAVAELGLTTFTELVLACDEETNNWYLTRQVPAGEQSFILKPRDRKSAKALVFHSQPQARAYWQAHGLNGQKSVRALVSATVVEHEGVKLYPLTPQHPTKAPVASAAPVIGAPVDVLGHLAEIHNTEFPSEVAAQPDVAPLPTDLPFLQAEQPATESVASQPAAPVVADAETRLEKLTDDWYEKDLAYIDEKDLTELLEGLAAKPKKERDIVENAVLNRAKTERARRNKKGGNRG